MSFNKTSFLCLILLMAVFIAAPVLAHQAGYDDFAKNHDGLDNTNPQQPDASETNHVHTTLPKVKSIELVNIPTTAQSGPPVVKSINTVYGDKVLTVEDADGNTIVLATAASANAEFQFMITFDQDVYGESSTAGTNDALNLDTTDFTINVTKSTASTTLISGVTMSSTPVDTDPDTAGVQASLTQFIITVNLGDAGEGALFGDPQADPVVPTDTLTLWVSLDKDAVQSQDNRFDNGVTQRDRNNGPSAVRKFTIIPAADTSKPTLEITHEPADDAALPASGMVTFTFTFTEEESSIATTGDGAFTKSDITVTGGDAAKAVFTETSNTVYKLAVTPTTPNTPVKVVVAANAVQNTAGLDLAAAKDATWTAPVVPDTDPPTVKITSSPKAGEDLPTKGPNKGKVVFTFTFEDDSPLGANDAAFTADDITLTNASGITPFTGSGMVYMLTVTPADPTKAVTVAITAGSVSDSEGNALAEGSSLTEAWAPKDKTPPNVVITSKKDLDDDGNITFIFDFDEPLGTTDGADFTSEDIDRVSSDVALIAGEPAAYTGTDAANPLKDAYTLEVKPNNPKSTINIILKSGSVADAVGNKLQGDRSGQWKPPTPDPVEIEEPVVAIAGPDLLDSIQADDNVITIVATDNVGIATELNEGGILVTNATKSDFVLTKTTAMSHTATIKLVPHHAAQFVTIRIGGGTVKDAAGNGNADKSITIEVAPLITVPANGHVVIVRERHKDDTILSDQPTLALPGIPIPAQDINRVTWEHMPDLKILFNIGETGTGGGALILKRANSHPSDKAVDMGSVVISEIMWATDNGILGNLYNDEQARQQWIELHNRNPHDAKVFIYARAGQDILNNAANDVANPSAPVIDVVTNYFDVKPGQAKWAIPKIVKNTDGSIEYERGQDGNSRTGVNFVSMMRKLEKDDDLSKGYKNGKDDASWASSTVPYYRAVTTDLDPKIYEFVGTPGRLNTFKPFQPPPTTLTVPFAANWGKKPDGSYNSNPISQTVIFNEIANLSDAKHEWIEFRNKTGSPLNLRNYLISMVTSNSSDAVFYEFPNNNNATIPANGVLLLVATNPRDAADHPLAVGWNVDSRDSDQPPGVNKETSPHYKVAENGFGNGLPNDGNFLLILRRPDNHEGHRSGGHGGKGVAETGNADLEKIQDLAGYRTGLSKSAYPNAVSSTKLWPLYNAPREPTFGSNKLEVGKVHTRRKDGQNGGLGGAGSANNTDGQSAFTDASISGIGYKRTVSRTHIHAGDPGYYNVLKSQVGHLADGQVYISEMMLAQGPANRPLPQWIELHNTSKTQAVNLAADAGWRLVIETPSTGITFGGEKTINFKSKGKVKVIEPNSTVLIVSARARSYGSSSYLNPANVFPETRVYNVWREHGTGFGMTKATDPMLPLAGFHIKLIDGKNNESDKVGNLDGNPRTVDKPKWSYPGDLTEDGNRSSLIRIYDDGVPREGKSIAAPGNVRPLGAKPAKKYSWVHAEDTNFTAAIFMYQTWWGAESDVGTPIQRAGAVLPVELSAFRPTLEDGKVVIHWTTESELDNAGFNIYRSETRTGEYKQVNAQLIEGAGTTGERTTYKWVDTSAKPGVVYYYQIEDVSFAGERQALAINRLKGYVNAKDKLTTRWGELKTLQ